MFLRCYIGIFFFFFLFVPEQGGVLHTSQLSLRVGPGRGFGTSSDGESDFEDVAVLRVGDSRFQSAQFNWANQLEKVASAVWAVQCTESGSVWNKTSSIPFRILYFFVICSLICFTFSFSAAFLSLESWSKGRKISAWGKIFLAVVDNCWYCFFIVSM